MNNSKPTLTAFVLAMAWAVTSQGATFNWVGDTSVDDDWSTPGNWSAANVPPQASSANNFHIDTGSSPANPVIYDTANETQFGNAGNSSTIGTTVGQAGYLAINSGTIRFSGGQNVIGASGLGVVTVNSGGILMHRDAGGLTIGSGANGQGIVTVNTGGLFVIDRASSTLGYNGSGTLNLHGGTLEFRRTTSNNNDPSLSIGNSSGTGTLDIRGGSVSTTGGTPTLKIGYNAGVGSGNAILIGYGSVNPRLNGTGNGLIQIGGQVIADGTNTSQVIADRNLVLNYAAGTGTGLTTANNTAGLHIGWYTQNHGAIDLVPANIGTLTGLAYWGDTASGRVSTDWTPGSPTNVLVNSAYVRTTTTGGTVDISLLDPTRDTAIDGVTALLDAPAGVEFLNIWQMSFSTAKTVNEFAVRYDESYSAVNAADKHGSLLGFYFWDGTTGNWIDLTAGTTLDTTNFLARFSGTGQSVASGGSGFFALATAIPEPASLALLGIGGLLMSPHRRAMR